MPTNRELQWLDWIHQLRAIAQIGTTYSKDPYDLDRYEQLTRITHEMYAALADAPVGIIADLFLPEKGYATPKVDLRGGVFDGDRILLVRERSDGGWTLPGGWADVLESPRQGIVREVKEESGFDVTNPRLVAIVDRSLHPYHPIFPYHIYKLFFLCELNSGNPTLNVEIDAIDFFSRDCIPPLSIDRVLAQDIERLFSARGNDFAAVYVD